VITVNTGYYNNFLRPKKLAEIISNDQVVVKDEKEADAREEIKQVSCVCTHMHTFKHTQAHMHTHIHTSTQTHTRRGEGGGCS